MAPRFRQVTRRKQISLPNIYFIYCHELVGCRAVYLWRLCNSFSKFWLVNVVSPQSCHVLLIVCVASLRSHLIVESWLHSCNSCRKMTHFVWRRSKSLKSKIHSVKWNEVMIDNNNYLFYLQFLWCYNLTGAFSQTYSPNLRF